MDSPRACSPRSSNEIPSASRSETNPDRSSHATEPTASGTIAADEAREGIGVRLRFASAFDDPPPGLLRHLLIFASRDWTMIRAYSSVEGPAPELESVGSSNAESGDGRPTLDPVGQN